MEKKKVKKQTKVEFPNLTKTDLELIIKNHLLEYTLKLMQVAEKGLLPVEEPRYLLAFISNWVEDKVRIVEEDLKKEM